MILGEVRVLPRRGTERSSIPDTAGAAEATLINPVVDKWATSPSISNTATAERTSRSEL